MNTPELVPIKMLLPRTDLEDIDRLRGPIPRERWVRDLCRAAVVARDAFDGPCYLRIKATARDGEQTEGVSMMEALDD